MVFALIEQKPGIFLDELQEELAWHYEVTVSIATLWNTLNRLGISSKKVSISLLCTALETDLLISFRRVPLSIAKRLRWPFSFKLLLRPLRVWSLQTSVGSISRSWIGFSGGPIVAPTHTCRVTLCVGIGEFACVLSSYHSRH